MTSLSVQDDAALESLVARVVDEFRERERRGERPTVAEYVARHPEAGEVLGKVLASLELLGLSASGGVKLAAEGGDGAELGTLGDFRLEREVGRGGMGVVYEAIQVSLNRRVALKVLPLAATLDPKQLQRFRNEAQAAACLHHTNIVPVYAVGTERGVHYYAMQFIDGQTLAAVIAERRRQRQQDRETRRQGDKETTAAYKGAATTPGHEPGGPTSVAPGSRVSWSAYFRTVAQLGVQAATALEHAHEQGVIHRDIKPANLLLDGKGNLWVTDFGLARLPSAAGLTLTGDLLGTLRYMSPEQALAKRVVVDQRTDIYSLGATLYELLTLEPAYGGRDREEVLRQITFEEPRLPRRLNKAIPTEVETIVLKAMEKDPADRYATARELANDLGRFLEEKPIRARRPTVVQWLRKWARRHQGLVWTGMVCLLLLTIGSVVSTVLIARERDEAHLLRMSAETHLRIIAERELQERRYRYVAEINLAVRSWEQGEYVRMRTLLDGHRPEPDQEDLRGFEWYFLWRLAQRDRTVLRGHEGQVYYSAFAPDGKTFATASQDRTAKIWDLATKQVRLTLTGHTDEVNWVSYSPDGATLVTASDDSTIRLWDGTSGAELDKLCGHEGPVVGAIFSPDGQTLYSAGRDKLVKVWDLKTRRIRATLRGHTDKLQGLAVSRDGKLLATASDDRTIRLWDLATEQEQARYECAHSVSAVAFSPDGRRLTAGQNSVAVVPVLEITQTGLLESHLSAIDTAVQSVAFHPTREWLTIADVKGRIHLIDTDVNTYLNTLDAGVGWVWGIAYSPDGHWLAATHRNNTVTLWNLAPPKYDPVRLPEPGPNVHRLSFSPDSRMLVAVTADPIARLWDTHTHQLRRTVQPPASLGSVHFTPEGALLGVARLESSFELWDLDRSRQLVVLPHTGQVRGLAQIAPDGQSVVTSRGNRTAVWDTTTGRERAALEYRHPDVGPASLAFSPGGKVLAYGFANHGYQLGLWDLTTGAVRESTGDHRGIINSVAWSPDGTMVATASWDATVKLWDAATLEERFTLLGHRHRVDRVTFSPDGKTLATGCMDGVTKLWNVATGQELLTLPAEPGFAVSALAFSPDGTMLATAAWGQRPDDHVMLWLAAPKEAHERQGLMEAKASAGK